MRAWLTAGWLLLAPVAHALECPTTLLVDTMTARLTVRNQPVRYYLEHLEALAALLDADEAGVLAAVRLGMGGHWTHEAIWTLQQNPRLHRLFFPYPH